jgi:RNA recognition motif-containing protein
MNIYVGNLSWNLKDQDLTELFTPYGEVSSAKIVIDKFTQRSKGFGFVEMPNDEQAQAAIAQMDGEYFSADTFEVSCLPEKFAFLV